MWLWLLIFSAAGAGGAPGRPSASGTASGSDPAGPLDGDRFGASTNSLWRSDTATGWWQVTFATPRTIGAVLQIHGDHPSRFHNAPRNYIWQFSQDGIHWQDLAETRVRREERLFRLHRLRAATPMRHIRLRIFLAEGQPALREVEFYECADARVPFPDWVLAVHSTEDSQATHVSTPFLTLARQCPGWEQVPAQQVWIGTIRPEFLEIEPRPLCAFFSGSFLEWCQRSREPWRGVQMVLNEGRLPIWAACGGAQALAILTDTGVDKEWDCPRCRDPNNPKVPVYTHIGHTGPGTCGDYSNCLSERGLYYIRPLSSDPVFDGLPEEFQVPESHVGQIAYAPEGWEVIATKGRDALTQNQCLRMRGRCIYAAQFHIEMEGAAETSRRIMSNFLAQAKAWGGYRTNAVASGR